ncbi:hypothetical protein RHMOL_Rhmol08G0209600 [Rhododendron molle]|uniref:Uncharacterized protein n=2 Tax=Rhododendron TaxID=4346 RepID=A0ACC0MSQ8_RHOML|nr:hypothetical protein RHGRI_024136 [Rhododendron griersonianum]KAI8543343.1 hypothetical protein RHMOL_Rhmol08G0209600 [Rhododendron molle]
MSFPTCRILLLLVCIGFLSIQPERVSGLRILDLALRKSRILKAVGLVEVQTPPPSLAPVPSLAFDPNQSCQRRVRRGSDPIHNRC